MKENDCTIDTSVAFPGKEVPFRRGKVVGLTANSKVVLVEWAGGTIAKVDVASLISEKEARAKEAELKAEERLLQEESAKLEREFEEVFNKVHPEIQEKIAQAAALIKEATEISEKHGIPFRPKKGTPYQMSYLPRSFKKKWGQLISGDEGYEFVVDLTDAYGDTTYGGWQSSQVC
jgi:hypothetical protein